MADGEREKREGKKDVRDGRTDSREDLLSKRKEKYLSGPLRWCVSLNGHTPRPPDSLSLSFSLRWYQRGRAVRSTTTKKKKPLRDPEVQKRSVVRQRLTAKRAGSTDVISMSLLEKARKREDWRNTTVMDVWCSSWRDQTKKSRDISWGEEKRGPRRIHHRYNTLTDTQSSFSRLVADFSSYSSFLFTLVSTHPRKSVSIIIKLPPWRMLYRINGIRRDIAYSVFGWVKEGILGDEGGSSCSCREKKGKTTRIYIYIYVPRLMCVCTGKSDDGDAHDAEPPFHKLAREPSHSPPSLF